MAKPYISESYNFGRPLLGYHYIILRFSDLHLGVEKKIFEEIKHFHYINLYDHTLVQEPLLWGIMKVTILVDPSLFISTIYLVCLIYARE